jgi:hypothetical protein
MGECSSKPEVKPHGNAAARRPQPPQNDAKKLSQEEKRALLVKCNAKDLQGEEIVRRPGDITGWDFNCSGLQECKVLIREQQIGGSEGSLHTVYIPYSECLPTYAFEPPG